MSNGNNRVKQERLNQGWSRSELAQKAGISEKTVYRIENGLPGMETTQYKIANALNLAVGFLFSEQILNEGES